MLDVLLPPAREVNFDDMQADRFGDAAEIPQDAARGRARRQGDRDRGLARCRRRWRSWRRRAWRSSPARSRACSSRWAAARRKLKKMTVAEAMKALTDEEAAQAPQRRRHQGQGARRRRAERHRVPGRDRQDREPRRRCTAPTCRARACSATCCRWSRARRSATKYGMVKTDHILFIASGAFHLSKPSDLIPELQGRFPIRVELVVAVGRRLRADPDRDRRLPHPAVRGAARHRAGRTSTSGPTASGAWPRSPSPSTRSRRTSARGACTR